MDNWSKFMVVVNATPDSFSDGGRYNKQNDFFKRMETLSSCSSCHIIDVGAQSTAPKNPGISAAEELSRFKHTLIAWMESYKNKFLDHGPIISVDTYRLETFQALASVYQGTQSLWMNDVSGVVTSELVDYFNHHPHFRYVLTHNRVSSQEEVPRHMSQARGSKGEELIAEIRDFFLERLARFKNQQQVILDVGFGFAKTREENLYLLDHWSEMISDFPQAQWLVGISKKSFLRPVGDSSTEAFQLAEEKQQHLIDKWQRELTGIKKIFRIHDEQIIH